MKRTFAAVALLAALGILLKLGVKEGRSSGPGQPRPDPVATRAADEPDPGPVLLAKYPEDRELVARTLRRYRQTAVAIERTDGLRGLALLDRLDLEAIYLYESHPTEFRRLRDSLTDAAAAELLLHWREYFGLKRSDDTDRAVLIAEVARLAPSRRRIAARYPNALPLILADPIGVTDLIERLADDPGALREALVVLDLISLEPGTTGLSQALKTLEDHGPLALEAFRLQGPEGFALVALYGPVLEALGDALPLDQALILLRVNTDFIDELLRTQRPEAVAGHLRHVAARGLVEAVGGSPNALHLVVAFRDRGDRALELAGPDAADVVFEDYSDPLLRHQAVEALAEHGTMALAVLAKYAADPDFREILRAHGPAVIPPIAQTDAGPEVLAALRSKAQRSFTESLALGISFLSGESGQGTIRTIKADGLERVAALNATDVQFYQFLPLYDLLHLGGVLSRGQAPTGGELTWALVDGCFVIADVLSLTALQPEGAVASEVARSEVKAATRAAAQGLGHELAEHGTEVAGRVVGRHLAQEGAEATAERLARWWAVRAAGGTYRVLRHLPEALGRLGVVEVADLGRPLCRKAGLELSRWAPMRFLVAGQQVLRRIPPERGLKYLGAQAAQASVGIVGFHKMEEYLASRRPLPPSD
ncbi:MAG TPA: hypothetical protein VF590_09555 [Isosphaeraceae bacterium]|jgi:hypothetical protein